MVRWVCLLLALGAFSGCRTTVEPISENDMRPAARLARAQQHFNAGQYTKAMLECIDLTRIEPEMPGLDALKKDVSKAIWEQRAKDAASRAAVVEGRMKTDADLRMNVPDTYGLRRGVLGETGPLRTGPTEMERALLKPVTVHLEGVTLNDFILTIGKDENINIIADNLDNAKTMTLHAEKVPLREILDYVARNLGVSFAVGRNMIWATPSQEAAAGGLPTETRLYRLRKGLSNAEIEGGTDNIGIIQAIQRFVPAAQGGDIYFNDKAHVLIVKNTRENLARVEDIIEALDVVPPQVMIEARFITTSVTDLRELGIDWVLNSSVGVTKQSVVRNGSVVSANETEISSGGSAEFTSFSSESSGLNLTYSGVLTDPMFEAVLHALDSSGKSRTLSVPKVATVNNRPATIRIGQDLLYFEKYDLREVRDGTDANGNALYRTETVPSGTPTREELGIKLDVTPSVGADLRSISLSLAPEISSFVRWEEWDTASTSSGSSSSSSSSVTNDTALIRLPVFARSTIETEVVVASGETVVMGGLIASTQSKTEEKIPFLSSIPLIGRLFRHDTSNVEESNLLIFVTATILSERGEDLVPILQEGAGPETAR